MDLCVKVKDSLLEKLEDTGFLDQSGGVLYSSFYTVKPGKFIIIGLNPGGDPKKIPNTLKEDIEDTFKKSKENPKWNAFFDEEWIPGEPGCDRLQVNLRYFIRLFLGDREELRNICATNLIFLRSKGEENISEPQKRAEIFWERVHKWLFQQVRPQIIITYSAFSYSFLKRKSKQKQVKEERIDFSSRIKIKIAKNLSFPFSEKISMIYVPHLSRYTFIGREDLVDKTKKALGGFL